MCEYWGFAGQILAFRDFSRGWGRRYGFRAASGHGFGSFDLCEEAVAATCNSFHKAGTFGRIAKGITDFVDCFIEPVIEIHESVCRPEAFLKFFASNDLARAVNSIDKTWKGCP